MIGKEPQHRKAREWYGNSFTRPEPDKIMSVWSDLRNQLNPDRYLEISQPKLSQHTTEVVDQLTSFLGLSQDEAHNAHAYLSTERPQATGTRKGDAEIYLEDVPWPDRVKEWILEAVEPVAGDWGYRLTRA